MNKAGQKIDAENSEIT